MNLRFYNVRILSMRDGQEIYEGELWTKEERIAFVGTKEEAETKRKEHRFTWDREIDGKGNLLMPGFKNAHTHSPMTFLRSFADDLPLFDWLHNKVFPMEAKLKPENMDVLTKLAILEYLSSGITAAFDMYIYPYEVAEAAAKAGFRMVICGSINDFTGSVKELDAYYQRLNAYHPLISCQLGFHAEYTTKESILRGVAELAEQYKAPVFMHNSETKDEVTQCIQRTGRTPMMYLDSLGMFTYGGGGFHCVHMTEEDLQLCVDKHVAVITNPASNAKLASGIAPLVKMQNMGILTAIGTDGPASNNCLDMFREMFLTTALQKLALSDAAAMEAEQVLKMAAVNGAEVMGLSDCRYLEEGSCADFIMLNLHRPNMQPLHNMKKNIVYSGSKENVKMTVVAGRILYEDGQFFIGEDAEAIYEKANTLITKML